MNLEEALQRIAELEAENQVLRSRLSEIERQLGLNSQTSSKPPSSDGFGKAVRRTQSLRGKSKRASGGQLEHAGATLEAVSEPAHVVIHPVAEHCPGCGRGLKEQPVSKLLKRQVFDVASLDLVVTEHQVQQKYCRHCQQRVEGVFPVGVNAPVQYGSKIRAVAAYLSHQHFIAEARVSDVLSDLFHCSLSPGTLAAITDTLSTTLSPITERIVRRVKAASVKHLDETGLRIAGKTQWLHVVSTPTDTWYRTAPTRKELSQLGDIQGVVVHDHWKPYFQLNGVSHSLCNAHHLRELKALSTIEHEGWATAMTRLLRLACHLKHRYCQGIPPPLQTRLTQLYDQIVARGLAFHQHQVPLPRSGSRGRPKRRVGHNLLLRLHAFQADALRFLSQWEVPFTNNQAERDLRMMKLKQKISGGFRSPKGASDFVCIRSVLSTARKRGLNLLELIESALCGDAPLLD
jgi:transposase